MSAHARLPSVDRIIRHAALAVVVDRYGVELVKATVRELQQQVRREPSPPPWATAADSIGTRSNSASTIVLGRAFETCST